MDRIKNLSLDQKAKLYYMGLVKKGEIDTLPEDPKAAFVRDMMGRKDELKEMATELGYLEEKTDVEKGKDVDYRPHTSKDISSFGNPDAKMYDSPNIKNNPKSDDFKKGDLEKLEDEINKITGGNVGSRQLARISDRGDKIRIQFRYVRSEINEKTWNKVLNYLKEKDFKILDQSNNYEENFDREEPPEQVPTINLKK